MKLKTLFKSQEASDDQWIATADLMATLMLFFAFITLLTITQKVDDTIDVITKDIEFVETDIYSALMKEFTYDERKKWGAEIDEKDGILKFSGQIIQFETNSDVIQQDFKYVLDDFFPRYVEIMRDFKDKIEEIDVEGHTDSTSTLDTEDKKYDYNMDLSQRRAFNVLKYSLSTLSNRKGYDPRNIIQLNYYDKNWVKKKLRSVGYSYSKLIYFKNGEEDKDSSKRVQFRIRVDQTNLREQIRDNQNKREEGN